MSLRRLLKISFAVLLLASLVFLFLHNHDGHDPHNCVVCRLAAQLVLVFALFIFAFLFPSLRSTPFSLVFPEKLHSVLLAGSLRDRSPPFLS